MTPPGPFRLVDLRTWLIWTAGFLAFPLAGLAGTAVAGRADDPIAALVGGAVTGLVLGPAQALALPRTTRSRWAWAAAMPALWALGWTVTTLGGISVEDQFTVFGAYGAVTFSALSGLLLHALLPHRAGPSPDATPTPAGASA